MKVPICRSDLNLTTDSGQIWLHKISKFECNLHKDHYCKVNKFCFSFAASKIDLTAGGDILWAP